MDILKKIVLLVSIYGLSFQDSFAKIYNSYKDVPSNAVEEYCIHMCSLSDYILTIVEVLFFCGFFVSLLVLLIRYRKNGINSIKYPGIGYIIGLLIILFGNSFGFIAPDYGFDFNYFGITLLFTSLLCLILILCILLGIIMKVKENEFLKSLLKIAFYIFIWSLVPMVLMLFTVSIFV